MRILPLALLISAAALPALAQQAAPSAAQLHLRVLTWPGKVAAPGQRAAPAVQPSAVQMAAPRRDLAWNPAYRPVPHGNSHMLGALTPQQAQAVDAQRAADRAEAEKALAMAAAAKAQDEAQNQPPPVRAQAQALPTSIYAPAPAQAAAMQPAAQPSRVATASAYDQKAHYYSVHRQYGQQPDPIALSPQFLSQPSADLADPPPPPPPRIMPGSTATAAQQTAARVQQRDSSDSGS